MSISQFPVGTGKIVLTFDDGPLPVETPFILNVLRQFDVKATFFVLGKQVEKHPEVARQILNEGHEIGNHSWSHGHFKGASPETIRSEMVRTQDIIRNVLGVEARTFRAPYFEEEPAVTTFAAQLGLTVVGNSVFSGDWMETLTSEDVIENSTGATYPGDIVMFHDWSSKTLVALPTILSKLRNKGLSFARADELIPKSWAELNAAI